MERKTALGVLASGIAVLGAGIIAAVTFGTSVGAHGVPHSASAAVPSGATTTIAPGPTITAAPAPTVPSTSTPTTTASKPPAVQYSAAAAAPAQPPITYTVKAGDNLTIIAAWFKLHGYQALYQANAAVIGANPNLIFRGEKITIGTGIMTVVGPQ